LRFLCFGSLAREKILAEMEWVEEEEMREVSLKGEMKSDFKGNLKLL